MATSGRARKRQLVKDGAMLLACILALFVCAAVIGGEWELAVIDGTLAVALAKWAIDDDADN